MWVPDYSYTAVLPRFLMNYGNFSLLIHTNTGCEYEDHSLYAQWSGLAWNMDMSIFTPWQQTDEFGEKLGTLENPTCMARNGVCGMQGYDPKSLCCSGMRCTAKDLTSGISVCM